ncbi:MAG: spore germination protein [Clostridia bacterium]|nr:spore germination protein [Clostridia bacterium]
MEENAWIPLQNGVLTEQYQQNIRLIRQAAHAEESEDVILRQFEAMGQKAALLYVDGLSDSETLQRFLLDPLLKAASPSDGTPLDAYLCETVLPLSSITPTSQLSTLINRVFSGDAALIVDTMPGALIAEAKGFVKRAVSEPVNESVVAGPHEGFMESLRDNTVLLRRMLRTPALISEQITVGNKVPVRLCMLYLDGVARRDNVEETRRRIAGCNADYVSSLGMLEQLIEDSPFALLPQAVATERPDRAVSFLNEGQIVLLMENAPQVLALPAGFLHFFHAPDDSALRWQYGTFLRLLRLIGMGISLLLPAVFIALTVYHPEGMSLSLLTSVIESQAKVPLSLFPSLLIMLLVFSLINEAGIRVPGAMGASLSIVGGLILGQAVVEAELISPLVLIVVALSGLGSYAAPSFSLTLSIRIIQLALAIGAGIGGYLGMTLVLFCLLLRAFRLTSLGQPYFAPLAPKRPANPDAVLRMPVWRQRLRGAIANPFHMNRVIGPMRAWDRPKEKP